MIGRPCSKIAVAAPLLPMISKGVVEIPISLSCNSFEIELLVSSPLSEKTKFKSLENFGFYLNPVSFFGDPLPVYELSFSTIPKSVLIWPLIHRKESSHMEFRKLQLEETQVLNHLNIHKMEYFRTCRDILRLFLDYPNGQESRN